MAEYSNTSPYFATGQNNISLDFFTPRTITAEEDDVSYMIDRIYAYRPDLLAFDLYENKDLWCRPCSQNGSRPCYRKEQYCMTEIDSEKVYSNVSRALTL